MTGLIILGALVLLVLIVVGTWHAAKLLVRGYENAETANSKERAE